MEIRKAKLHRNQGQWSMQQRSHIAKKKQVDLETGGS